MRASDYLHQREREWRPALRAVSLVAEIAVPELEARRAVSALGKLYGAGSEYEQRQFLHYRYPACLLVGLSGIGASRYEQGNYWGAVDDHTHGQFDPTAWGAAFRANLDQFGLARFPGLPQINVGEILMHGGIPAYCLGDLLNLLLQRQSREPGTTVADFFAWALTPGRESRLNTLDVPVRRLLQHGGEYAEDLVDRCLDLLDRFRVPAFNADGLGLPPHLIDQARGYVDAGQLDWAGTAARTGTAAGGSGGAATPRPYVELEPYGRGLLVRLPAVPDAPGGRVEWRVRVGEDVQTIVSRSRIPGDVDTAPPAVATISRPARQVTVELAAIEREFELDLIDPREPMLIFTDEGRRVPLTASLPPEPVWILHAARDGNGQPVTLHIDRAAAASTGAGGADPAADGDLPVPYGWFGWTLRRVDLGQVTGLRLADGPARRVGTARRAQLRLSPPLPDVVSVAGTPVYGAAPLLTLPTEAGVATEWSIRVRRPGSAELLTGTSVRITDDTVTDPWEQLPRPLVGSYEITVRGPLGRGLSRTIDLAEGLTVAGHPVWRELRPDGLAPATVRLGAAASALRVDPPLTRLDPTQTSADVQLTAAGHTTTVRVTPPHMAAQWVSAGRTTPWSLQPLRLDTETVGDGELLVRLPAAVDADLVVTSGGQQRQTVASRATYGQPLARFPLAAIADTVRVCGSAQLAVRLSGQQFPVARCLPRQLAGTVHLKDDQLVLGDASPVNGLTAGVYQVLAPWRPPHVTAIGTDLASEPLPADLTRTGPLAVLLRVDDPWLPEPWPDWPGPDNSFTVDGDWDPPLPDTPDTALSRHLAGLADLPDRPDVAPLILPLYRRAEDLRRHGVTVDVRATAAVLRRHPVAALTALTRTRSPAAELVAPLVHSGLVALPPLAYLGTADEARLWQTSPLAALLATAYRLAVTAAGDDLHERAATACGDSLDVLLAGQPDPHRAVGRFDQAAQQLARLPAEQRDELWRAMRIVPGGLLDADERVAAARRLFDVRNRPGVARVAAAGADLLRTLRPALAAAGGPVVDAAVGARQCGPGWPDLPALSLAFAFTARLVARDRLPAALLTRTIAHHATLARHAPDLTTIDIFLAELTLTGDAE
ncbi:hypothetical protein O7623_03825 [Solwaraspora sp. WMMD791]|uniref:hypothetical protein n=1 Tax=Solwaraspora sp. WMMD791 TaxID=3016086 RepID=UPI00249A59D5|nr:hypothetical protein [Solwaraspora sp. WMMD791]WFE28352.1 hypothetical protein O7623_03825 [Solwaraspora sp. WMMD791]